MTPRADAPAPAPLAVTTREGAVVLAGALVFDTVPDALSRSLAVLVASGPLVVDFGGVTHADSAALALIVEWRRIAEGRGVTLELLNLPPQLRALAAATGLEELVP